MRPVWVRLLSVVALAWFACTPVHATPDDETAFGMERRLKAAFIYKFAQYIEWPADAFASPAAPLIVGIVGADSIAEELQAATEGHAVKDHPIVVQRIKPGASIAAIQVLFVGKSEAARLSHWLNAVNRRPVLVITESEDALEQGSTINFTTEERRVRFAISLASADRNRLRIDSRLLGVAQRVYRTQ